MFLETVERLNAEPVLLEAEDPNTGEVRRTWMNGNSVVALSFQLLYDSRLRYLLPQRFAAASQVDLKAFEEAIAALVRLAGRRQVRRSRQAATDHERKRGNRRLWPIRLALRDRPSCLMPGGRPLWKSAWRHRRTYAWEDPMRRAIPIVEPSAFLLLAVGTLGLRANEFVLDWGRTARLVFAGVSATGLLALALADWGNSIVAYIK